MDPTRIAELLQPFGVSSLDPQQLKDISMYIDILLRWNARVNLTAVRASEEIVTRHFGESLFAARHLFPDPPLGASVIDVGSGAGFPGLPIKIWNSQAHLTLIESNQKKATFLKEVSRALTLMDVNVFSGRTQRYPGPRAAVITLRAVEKFADVLPLAVDLVSSGGMAALLIGEGQVEEAERLCPEMNWTSPIPMPHSRGRVLLVGRRG